MGIFSALVQIAVAVKNFALKIAQFLALKILIISVVAIGIPWALYSFINAYSSEIMTWINLTIINAGLPPIAVEITSFGAWMGSHMNLPEATTIFLA